MMKAVILQYLCLNDKSYVHVTEQALSDNVNKLTCEGKYFITKSQFKIAVIIWPSRKRLMTLLLRTQKYYSGKIH